MERAIPAAEKVETGARGRVEQAKRGETFSETARRIAESQSSDTPKSRRESRKARKEVSIASPEKTSDDESIESQSQADDDSDNEVLESHSDLNEADTSHEDYEDDDSDVDADEAEDDIKAPSQWRDAVKGEWSKLPRTVKEEVIRRENALMTAASRYAQEAQQLKEQLQSGEGQKGFDPEVESYLRESYGEKADPVEIQRNYANFDHVVRTSPFHAIAQIAAIHGVKTPQDLDRFLDSLDNWVGNGGYRTPPPTRLQRQQKAQLPPDVEQRLSQIERYAMQSRGESVKSMFVSWATERDERGEVKRPFAASVESDMAVEMQRRQLTADDLTAEILQDVYDTVVTRNPETRRKLIEIEAARRRNAAIDKAKKSQTAGSSVRSSTPQGGQKIKAVRGESFSETLRRLSSQRN